VGLETWGQRAAASLETWVQPAGRDERGLPES
jgi:hypothetical protein